MSPLYRAGMLLVLGLLPALSPGAQPRPLAFERITEEAGLPGGVVSAIQQDQQGFLWVGTWVGLARYDGYAFTHFHHDPADPTSRRPGPVESLYADSKGYVWVGYYGNDGGLDRYDPATETFTHFHHDPDDPGSISEGQVITSYEDSKGFVWVSIQGYGVDRYDPETDTFTHYPHDVDDPASLSSASVRVIYEDSRGVLWFGAGEPGSRPESGGLNRYDPERDAFTRYLHDPEDPTSLGDNRVQVVYEDARGTLWIGTWGDGLHTYDRERDAFTRFTYDPDDPSRPSLPRLRRSSEISDPLGSGITVVHEDRDGILWIGGYLGGLDRYDPATGRRTHYEYDPNDPHSLGDNRIWRMCESHDGTLWIATWGGLFKVNLAAGRFRSYMHDPNDPRTVGPYYVTALHENRSGDLWVGTSRGGLQKLNRDSGTFTSIPADHAHSRPTDYWVSRIFEDRSGTLWVGSNGLKYLDRRTERVVAADIALSSAILEIHEDEEEVLWIGTPRGLYRYDRRADTLAHFRHEQQDPNLRPFDVIHAIGEAPNGALWLGTAGGLSRFDRATNTFTIVLEDITVMALFERRQGEVWLATASQGLLLYDAETGKSTSYTTADGLADNTIGGILEDDQGFLWLGTNRGLSRFDVARRSFRNYDVTAGLPTNILGTDGQTKAAAKGHSGALYFRGMGGFVMVSPELTADNPAPPRLALTGLRYTDRNRRARAHPEVALPLSPAGNMRLVHTQNDLTFEYVGLHFANSAGNEYAHMLEGYEDAWRYVGAQRTATYTNLSPGAYTFRVKAANADGVWNEEGASLDFVILPPWWQTGWAYALYVVLFIAGFVAANRIQRGRLIRKERAKAAIREAELRAQAAHERAATLQQIDALKSRFFANISHEFRTPLTLILGPVQDALRDERGLAGHQLDLIRRNGQRLLRLINQLLDLSKLDAGGMELHARPGDLAAFLRRLILSFTSRAEREGIALSFSAEPEQIATTFDRDMLEKIVSNLLSNAFKWTPTGGKIALSARTFDDTVEVSVRDTGPGIPKGEILRLFDRFYQVDGSPTRRHEGSGIGLALVKELVDLHGGAISVESQVGFGTAFVVTLPLVEVPDEELEPVEDEALEELKDTWTYEGEGKKIETRGPGRRPTEDTRPAHRATVLLVEDNADVRAYVRGHLEHDYEIYEAGDGLEGLAKAREIQPDLVIADVMMPRMDGFALTRAIRSDEDLNHIPIVLLTAKADLESRVEGLEEGADDYLPKPFDAEELLARVESLIEIRRLLRERFSGEVLLGPRDIAVPSEDALFLERIREVTEAQMTHPNFGVDQLADEVALSPRQLQRRLKKLTNLSAAGYIRMMRFARAAQLLEQEAGSISEIAYRVGYKDVDHFSKVFKQIYKVVPSAYGGINP